MFGARRVARRTARRTSRRVARRSMFMSGGYGGDQYQEEPYGEEYYEEEPYTAPTETKPTIEQQLQSLQDIKNRGLITEEDYNSKKKLILGI